MSEHQPTTTPVKAWACRYEDTVTPEQRDRYIRARDNNQCQRLTPGCTHTCDLVEHTLTPTQLASLHRDPDSPDNWICSCTNCSTQDGS